MTQIINAVKEKDIFGHQFTFKIGKGQSDTYKSVCGGITSILIYTLLTCYLVSKVNLMQKGSLDNMVFKEQALDYSKFGKYSMDGMGF